MGTCLSKKSVCATCSPIALPDPPAAAAPEKFKSETQIEEKKDKKKKGEEQQAVVKKEIFIIKHRTSHEMERQRSDEERGESADKAHESGEIESSNANCGVIGGGVGAAVRTSSCTKEEVDAILIQCGRLSRSSSAAKSAENGGRKYSGSKRSYDFDNDTGNNGDDERENRRRERQRQSPGRRRTPSRERELQLQPRSGSRERGGGRRVSRSPGRRSESPITTRANSDPNSNASSNSRPGKMVSVPATVSDPNANASSIKRIQVKRNAGSAAASPRARSPARTCRASGENQQQPLSLSRSNSRKADNSPYRRNPLALTEIDTNIISHSQKPNAENKTQLDNLTVEETKGSFIVAENVAVNVIPSGQDKENQRIPQTVTRSRSSRLSRDLDAMNPETLTNPNASSSYTALLLEDIQNFHQKNSNPPPTVFNFPVAVPPCVTKAQSILEAVANLNSTTGQHMSKISADKKPTKHHPILESEAVGNDDDLMEPSFHKYVTVRRGTGTSSTNDYEEQQEESSGSNSFVGSQQLQQQWVSASCWETNSAESTDRWTFSSSSSSKPRALGKQNTPSESGEGGKRVITKKRDSDHQSSGRIGRRGPHLPALAAATAAST